MLTLRCVPVRSNLTGRFPALQAPNLAALAIERNHFEGAVLPAGGDLPLLVTLIAGNNRFTELGDLSLTPTLGLLDINSNPMGGQSLPASLWEDAPHLDELDASFCSLSGNIPAPNEQLDTGNLILSHNQLTVSALQTVQHTSLCSHRCSHDASAVVLRVRCRCC